MILQKSVLRAAPLCVALTFLLGGCASALPDKPAHVQAFDLGPAPSLPAAAAPRGSVIALEPMQAPADLQTQRMTYRLLYAGDEQQPRPYARAGWAMSPPELVQQRLRDALAAQHTVLSDAVGLSALRVQAELTEFDQVFSAADSSAGVVTLRVTALAPAASGAPAALAQRLFTARSPAASANAAGGAQALRTATDDVVQQVVQWLGALPRPAASAGK